MTKTPDASLGPADHAGHTRFDPNWPADPNAAWPTGPTGCIIWDVGRHPKLPWVTLACNKDDFGAIMVIDARSGAMVSATAADESAGWANDGLVRWDESGTRLATNADTSRVRTFRQVFEVAVVALLACSTPACSDRQLGKECYPPDPWEEQRNEVAEYAFGPEAYPDEILDMERVIGFCDAETESEEPLSAYDAYRIDRIKACSPNDNEEDCSACGEQAAAADALVLSEYDERQDAQGCAADEREVLEFVRGCSGRYLVEPGVYRCCYRAYIVSECETDVEIPR